ncbi:aconitate hydratase [Desulfuromusa kysingii]|uniref:Aconitate hydratase n=2 Tax=Desulfuromusa kysingii TaxID=37625 RepID=A0A1H4AJ07_9BACT|nr:aconitate hydratase AcnA [Desulfuromusa kysingii]SEA35807.1 aconitate hydratase [Desulfuromusa kysingii]
MSNSFNTEKSLQVAGHEYRYHSLKAFAVASSYRLEQLPFTIKVLLENLLRKEDGHSVMRSDIEAVAGWNPNQDQSGEISYSPARVLMQDFTGVPAIVDLAAMRDSVAKNGGDPAKINPQIPVDLVIDHSVMVDHFGNPEALADNVKREMERNRERYAFLRWGQNVFDNFRVVPPGTGICHQVNLEYLAQGVWSQKVNGELWAYPDTLVGTDSHTTMINGLGVLGWGVGGIEAEAAMLGQPISMLIPEVVGFRLSGHLNEGITATDLVLTVTQMLRSHGVVGKFVEFFGTGLSQLPLADRATIANMSPEYGATCGFFPIDQVTLDYLTLSGRSPETVALVESYCKEQGLWRADDLPDPTYSAVLELDLTTVKPSLAGPKRPQDRVLLENMGIETEKVLPEDNRDKGVPIANSNDQLNHGDVVIAAITSCTNTSNPAVMMAAGLVAKKAVEKGLSQKSWVKTSLAPGSKVVTDYLAKAGLQSYLDQLGFNIVGYGCTTCIGNSGPLTGPVAEAIDANDMSVCSVLSGNRNFEGRIHAQVKSNWLASPPLVVAFALAGTTCIDLTSEPLGEDQSGQPVYLKDIWPSNAEVAEMVALVNAQMFLKEYAAVFTGDESWQSLAIPDGLTYSWEPDSTYIRLPSFFDKLQASTTYPGVNDARILALLGDSITTDHISPAGAIKGASPAGEYLQEHNVKELDFNSYGSRRGNHEVMVRGTFANIRLRNKMVPETEGGMTKHLPDGEEMSIFAAANRYKKDNVPLVVIAGKEYGTGSSRDWAAKGTQLLGVKAVLAESYERIHRSNLVGMGVLPLQFLPGSSAESLRLDGSEIVSIPVVEGLQAKQNLTITLTRSDGSKEELKVLCRIDTDQEVIFFQSGGILNHVLLQLMK